MLSITLACLFVAVGSAVVTHVRDMAAVKAGEEVQLSRMRGVPGVPPVAIEYRPGDAPVDPPVDPRDPSLERWFAEYQRANPGPALPLPASYGADMPSAAGS